MPDFSGLFLQMMVVLALVCVVAFGVLRYILPRLPMANRFQKNQFIQIVARQHLDQRRQLWISKVGERYFFLGATDHQITLISEVSAKDVAVGGES